ncbi:cytidylyltransferase domain-containing protein [Silvanigrella aquatica]|uniref:Spore coat protein n=1 Tax=Silvanigrella aquatica TaxID=1915309 RepID=A0A1L4D2Y6_9BACT|nr:NTP transferase domain-containing protein [Silvanigrella aquatica]APJ04568.1 hypothetical protein AXG55_11890 [Silvanigrella aquatica]
MNQRIVAVIAVRMDSVRLPGKTLFNIHGKPLLEHLLDRVKSTYYIDDIIVATSHETVDNPIEVFCNKYGVSCYRGSKEHVLERIKEALAQSKATIGVNIYGDGPLICPEIIDYMILTFLMQDFDFVSNTLETTFPPGMEVEVFKFETLEKSYQLVSSSEELEHATLFIRKHPDIFKIYNSRANGKYYLPNHHLEVDEIKDTLLIEKIIEYQLITQDLSFNGIYNFFQKNPEASSLNQSVFRKWKQFREKQC